MGDDRFGPCLASGLKFAAPFEEATSNGTALFILSDPFVLDKAFTDDNPFIADGCAISWRCPLTNAVEAVGSSKAVYKVGQGSLQQNKSTEKTNKGDT